MGAHDIALGTDEQQFQPVAQWSRATGTNPKTGNQSIMSQNLFTNKRQPVECENCGKLTLGTQWFDLCPTCLAEAYQINAHNDGNHDPKQGGIFDPTCPQCQGENK